LYIGEQDREGGVTKKAVQEMYWKKTLGFLVLFFVLAMEMLASSSQVFGDSDDPVPGGMIDVFVGKGGVPYPSPYGGQGPMQVADMFEPGLIVSVWAFATYDGNPAPNKLVTFIIYSPSGLHDLSRSALTNATGYAYLEFAFPWPVVDPEAEIFGTWSITTRVDLYSNIFEDTVWFRVWWVIEITSLRPKATVFHVNSFAVFDIYYRTYRMQPIDTIIEITLYDDSDIPFSAVRFKLDGRGWNNYTWNMFRNYTMQFKMYIPKWAFEGPGKAYANAFYFDPTKPYGLGSPMCPEASATFTILKTPVGDVDNDGNVDGQDLAIVAVAFGTRPIDLRWDSRADLNYDDRIDGKDVAITAKNFGKSV
jgi:hypothetical protein